MEGPTVYFQPFLKSREIFLRSFDFHIKNTQKDAALPSDWRAALKKNNLKLIFYFKLWPSDRWYVLLKTRLLDNFTHNKNNKNKIKINIKSVKFIQISIQQKNIRNQEPQKSKRAQYSSCSIYNNNKTRFPQNHCENNNTKEFATCIHCTTLTYTHNNILTHTYTCTHTYTKLFALMHHKQNRIAIGNARQLRLLIHEAPEHRVWVN